MAAEERAGARKKPALKLDIGHLTEKNVGQLKKLNVATFPITYHEGFYKLLWNHLEYSRLGFYAEILVAAICCRIEQRPQGGNALYIMTLSVLEPYQRRSLAQQLMKWAIEKAESEEQKSDNIEEMYLHVQTSNEAAINFYKGFGFEISETIEDYYLNITPASCYILRKPMNGGTVSGPGGIGSDSKPIEAAA
mmetsp:Transcript_16613/g.35776  ORF Transcript_16613/g.35776 Transcript_16613/m.35776 type:complete len:193 (-) Transcript_16613:80-658(-)|eukprot:CAMPEP_0206481012 /NCGR_PEP_ID=MMETSP0324_2-20121206/37831_1 /ASSEMBLY_ACC=CAM_ASM_000836 /TAXON_ID=2866 /ORGANISM="Crypthecodinium cohnii, Strain Seligo" /LENGTH=192 /DNA_ID=CAMNT_0053958299 /DNA_START=168 /DNA_END=746 /DNA_ORIENTATION=+